LRESVRRFKNIKKSVSDMMNHSKTRSNRDVVAKEKERKVEKIKKIMWGIFLVENGVSIFILLGACISLKLGII